uniref:Uncharacterized protein n=1 Tax=Felis catus TaxID=9685 RepID=A0ABI7Z1K0_FELCA
MKGLSPSSDLLPLAFEENDTTLVRILRSIARRLPGRLQTVTNGVECLIYTDWMCHKFTNSRIADSVFQPSPADHEKYGEDPQHPRKLHIVTRVKSTKRCPYWEKDRTKMPGLEKAHTSQVPQEYSFRECKTEKRIPSRLHTVSTEPDTGLDLTNHVIMTRAKIESWMLNELSHPVALILSLSLSQKKKVVGKCSHENIF